ncbi:MAG: alpha/beta hydrolase [Acidimicrobiia bacterium]|nr:alpha/beta hydrolase [Acidimicrobiia bacterium]
MGEARYREAERALWSATGVEPEEIWITLARSGSKVRVLAVGEGPPVVFVHGATNGASSWATLAARLPGHRCWLVDRPGCGLSEPTGTRLRNADALAGFADDLVADVLDGLELERVSLVGTSFGGYFVLRAAAAHPNRVDRLVTLSWSLGAPIERVAPAMRIAGVRSLGFLMARIPPSKAAVKGLLRQIGLRNAIDSGQFDETALRWFRSLLRDTPTMRNELDAAPPVVRPITGLDEDLLLGDDTLQRISAPTLLIWGADDPQGGAATARAFAARIPGATLEIMVAAGHAPWMDDPGHVAKALNRFLSPD